MASLIIIAGPNEGDYYPLGQRTMVVGRDEACPIQVADDLVSRKHLQVRFESAHDSYHALDMKSANGVNINGRQMTGDTQLQDGDIIELGNSRIMFTEQDFPDRESAMLHFKQRGERGRSTLIR